MYKYASKFSPNQMNLISSRLRYGNHVLTKDKNSSWPFRQVNHVRANIPLNLVSVENYTPIWPATYFTNKRYFSATRTSKPNILAKYYRLTAGRSSLAKISKNSLQQSRGYASLLKKITGFFSAKPATPVKPTRVQKCKNVKACAKKTEKKVCIKVPAPPPPIINFEEATKSQTEIMKEEVKYINAICPSKLEVGQGKEKPPFACDGGPFLEDRLCREMPEKRCQKLLEEYELKKEKLEEKLEEEANSKCELKSAEIKTSVEKEKCKPLSEICPEIPKPEFKDECANPLHETVCIPVVHHQLSINKCRHVKACKAKMTKARECDSSNLKPCQTVPDCSTINKDMSIELRPCSAIESIAKCPIKVNPCDNVKPCPSKKVEEVPLEKDPCRNTKACPKLKKCDSKCGMIVRPCGSAYKRKDCSNRDKFKSATTSNVACQTAKERIECKQTKCSVSAKKPRSCSEENAKKGDACKKQQRMATCSELKAKSKKASSEDKSKKESRCRTTKKCESTEDKCNKKPAKKDGCSSGKGGPPIRCYSKANLDPIKFYSTRNIDQFLCLPAETIKPLEEIIIKPNKYTTSKSTITLQPQELSAYSKISMKLDGTGVISMKMDVADDTADNVLLQGNANRRRLLYPMMNSSQSAQIRDSKSYAISSPNLSKLYGLKCSIPHKLGKIPELPRTSRFCVSNPNLTNTARFGPQIFCAAFHSFNKDRNIELNISGKRSESSANKTPEKKDDEDKCEKMACPPPPPCCKKEKDKCEMPAAQLKKELKSCSLPKPEPVKTEAKKPAKSPCNFDQAIKTEAKHKAKEFCPPPTYIQIDVCPPKKQLCCYQKKCRQKKSAKQDNECIMCKKFQILDIPPKPQPKPTVCKIIKCGARKPCSVGTKTPLTDCVPKGIEKRGEICPKCEKPKFKLAEEKPKKRPPSVSTRCTNMPCVQKKCTKKIPKPPCPDPIKTPKPTDQKTDPCAKPCIKKPKPPMDEAARKSLAKKCAKPPGKKASKAGLVCENPAVALEKSRKLEQERLEKEAQAKAYAEMKHTEWRAVAVKGDNRWCKPTPVEKVVESKTDLSKTVLPTTEEKYQSPRYKKSGNKAPCSSSKKCPKAKNKHIRKLHSCPYLGPTYTNLAVKSTNSVNIPRDYFENMASLIPVKEIIVENEEEKFDGNKTEQQ